VRSNTEQKRHIWEFMGMSLRGEVDPALTEFFWHWLMFPMLDLLGPELVYAVGLESLGYPPTWVDTKQEADQVETAVMEFLERKNKC
jgi:hypothetical protein